MSKSTWLKRIFLGVFVVSFLGHNGIMAMQERRVLGEESSSELPDPIQVARRVAKGKGPQRQLVDDDFSRLILATSPEEIKELIFVLKNPHCSPDRLPKKILLDGRSGMGKTEVAKVIAQELGRQYYQISTANFLRGNELQFQKFIQTLSESREPYLVELDRKGAKLDLLESDFLKTLDSYEDDASVVFVLSSENAAEEPECIQRRFEERGRIFLPELEDYKDRQAILQYYFAKKRSCFK